jgi:hypothetical protein
MKYDIEISKKKADQIKDSALLDLDIQVSESPGSHGKCFSAQIINERSHLMLCETDAIFSSKEHALFVLNKIIAAIQNNDKSKKFVIETTYNLKID